MLIKKSKLLPILLQRQMDSYLERLLGEETYFSERIGTMIISGYTYTNKTTNQDKMAFHISLSSAENASINLPLTESFEIR